MARIFWIKCPYCEKKFYCDYFDFRPHPHRKLLCPYCNRTFLQEESSEIDDRWE